MPTTPRYPGVYVEELPSQPNSIVPATTAVAAFVDAFEQGPIDTPTPVTSFRDFTASFGTVTPASKASYGIRQFFLNGGSNAVVVRTGKVPRDAAGPIDSASLDALAKVRFDLLCLPAMSDLTLSAWLETYALAVNLCEQQHAFFIADPPTIAFANEPSVDAQVHKLTTWFSEVSNKSSHSALYFPRLDIPDPADADTLLTTEASGTVAGVMARTDTEVGVWKAPAGTEATLSGVLRPASHLDDGQNAVLNPLGINAIRTLPVHGSVVWGARTMLGADAFGSEWKYVPVRRLANLIERSIIDGTRWTVFEPNGESTWARLRLSVEGFLSELYRAGAFSGSTASEAFSVRCDATTTTQADQDQGRMNLVVGFAPLKPAEFVFLNFSLAATA